MPGLQCLLLFLFVAAVGYCAATLLRGGLLRSRLGRGIHRRLVGADVTEQDGTVRQILLHQAGAGRRNRASDHRVHRTDVVPAPVQVHMAVAVVAMVVVMAMAPEAAVDMPVTVVMVVVVMTVPVTMVVVMTVAMTTVAVMTMMTVRTVMAVAAVVTAAMMTATVMTMTATLTVATMAAGVSSSRDERRQANNGRGDESEECRTFEHCQRPLARCEPSVPLVEGSGPQVQPIDFRYVFVHLTFIDRATVWQDGGTHRIAIVRAAS